MFRHVAELQVSVHLAGAGQSADDGAEAAAVDESDFAQVQHDGAAVAQQPGDVGAQGLALAAGNDPPVAAHDGDASDLTSSSDRRNEISDAAGISLPKSLYYSHLFL